MAQEKYTGPKIFCKIYNWKDCPETCPLNNQTREDIPILFRVTNAVRSAQGLPTHKNMDAYVAFKSKIPLKLRARYSKENSEALGERSTLCVLNDQSDNTLR